MKKIKPGNYLMSINEEGFVMIHLIDTNDNKSCYYVQCLSARSPKEIFPNIQAAFVNFLRPRYKAICGK